MSVDAAMPDSEQRHYRFGPFQLDLRTRELRKGGQPVAITAKAFDVLRVLVEHRGRVVGRDELLSTVWAGRVVEENNLTQAIAALRRVFGTDAQDHSYIVTLPGRGYRFVADVEDDAGVGAVAASTAPGAGAGTARTAGAATAATAAGAGLPGAPARRPRWTGLPLVAAALLLAVLVPAFWPRSLREASAPVQPGRPGSGQPATPPLTLAILPFQALPEEPLDELLELGLADTLITRISGATSLRVRPLSSSRRFSGGAHDPVEAARQLGAAYVLDGSTRRHGTTVEIDARLLSADGRLLWSRRFEAHLGRVFTLQDDIANALAAALDVALPPPAQRSPCDGEDAAAYRAYLSGQYRISRPSAESGLQALADFRRALDLDPTCARAYAAMAHTYRTLVATADADPIENFARANTLVDRALALDPLLSEAHLARGWIEFWHEWDWAAAEASFQRAIELNPSLAEAYFGQAHLLANIGREAEAAALARTAMALDPLSPVINAIGGWFVAPPGEVGHYMDRALELDPDYWLALLMRGTTRVAAGDAAGGLADLDRARQLCGDCSHALTMRGALEARAGHRDAALHILREMEARDRAGYWPATSLATVHNALGDTGAALDQLERAWRERDMRMAFLKADEALRWRNLRGEPRYRALMQRMDFPVPPDGPGKVDAAVRTRTQASVHTSAADRSSR